MTPYRELGNLSSAPPERSVRLWCDLCEVAWTGCQDAATCPECDDTSVYDTIQAVESQMIEEWQD